MKILQLIKLGQALYSIEINKSTKSFKATTYTLDRNLHQILLNTILACNSISTESFHFISSVNSLATALKPRWKSFEINPKITYSNHMQHENYSRSDGFETFASNNLKRISFCTGDFSAVFPFPYAVKSGNSKNRIRSA